MTVPEKGFRFDDTLNKQMYDLFAGLLKPHTMQQAIKAFEYLDEATAGWHQAITSYFLGYLVCMFHSYYLKGKRREPTDEESVALMEWLTKTVVPIIESSLTEYEKKRELR